MRRLLVENPQVAYQNRVPKPQGNRTGISIQA